LRSGLASIGSGTLGGVVPALLGAVKAEACSGTTVLVTKNNLVATGLPSTGLAASTKRIDQPLTNGALQGVRFRPQTGGGYAILAANRLYWSLKPGGTVLADAQTVGPNELFDLEEGPVQQVSLCTTNRKWCPSSPANAPTVSIRLHARPASMWVGIKRQGDNALLTASTTGTKELFQTLCVDQLGAAWAGKDYADAISNVPRYKQIPPGEWPNTTGACTTGCAATAWGILFGWADRLAELTSATNHGLWQAHWRIYGGKQGQVAPMEFATTAKGDGARDLIYKIFPLINGGFAFAGCKRTTFGGVNNTEQWTHPSQMSGAANFFTNRVAMSLSAQYDGLGNSSQDGLLEVRDLIRYRQRPVIVGEGTFDHYSVAVGHLTWSYRVWNGSWKPASKMQLEVNEGWGDSVTFAIPALSWFAGWLHPTSNPLDDTLGGLAPGAACQTHKACASLRCLVASGQTSGKCLPKDHAGNAGDFCNDHAQCRSLDCSVPPGKTTGACTATNRGLGQKCVTNQECSSGLCDPNTGGGCVPNRTGNVGDFCTDHAQCRSAYCKVTSGRSGTCSATSKGLGQKCVTNQECSSGLCDPNTGGGCVPNRTGNAGDFCTDHAQCRSQYYCKLTTGLRSGKCTVRP
jgi:hypothetical protein